MKNWRHLQDISLEHTLDLNAQEQEILANLAERLQENYPYNSTAYAGQMIKPAHPIAYGAYWLTSLVNPNNHALDGGIATSKLELECIAQLGKMLGQEQTLGHLTSGGTVANLEALWVSRQLHPNTVVLANENAHYTHQRMCGVLGLQFKEVRSNAHGQMSTEHLDELLGQHPHCTVVATLGTTGSGAVDPLEDILPMARNHGARVHVDAAYGGYFGLASNTSIAVQQAFAVTGRADSIVIDPHKHGLQPYGCGCVLFADPKVGQLYAHDSPYTYFTSSDLHLGEITLECSRPGAAAGALWATMQRFPLEKGGEFSARLDQGIAAAKMLVDKCRDQGMYALDPSLDIAIYSMTGESAQSMSQANREAFARAEQRGVYLALFELKKENCPWAIEWDQQSVTVLRSVLMKPEHNNIDVVDKIYQALLP